MTTKRAPAIRSTWPWDQVALELHEISAIKAIAAQNPAGFAALERLTGVDAASFTAGGEDGRRATDFAEGKRWVGRTLRAIVGMKLPGPKPGPSGPHDVPKGEPPAN